MFTRIPFFKGDYSFLSNFYPVQIEYEGLVYSSLEAAYQASKSDDVNVRMKFTLYSASKSKREGSSLVKNKKEWYPKSLKIMEDLLRIKFSKDPLKTFLINTGNKELVEGNTWHDNFFGSCICDKCANTGENHLGKLLMKIRHDLIQE